MYFSQKMAKKRPISHKNPVIFQKETGLQNIKNTPVH